MVGIRPFPFGARPIFRCVKPVSFRECIFILKISKHQFDTKVLYNRTLHSSQYIYIYTSILYDMCLFKRCFSSELFRKIRFTDFLHTNLLETPMMKQLRVSRFRHMLQWRRSLEHVPDEFLLCFVISESWYLVRMLPRWWFQIFSMFIPIWGNDPFRLIFLKWVETTN